MQAYDAVMNCVIVYLSKLFFLSMLCYYAMDLNDSVQISNVVISFISSASVRVY
jgi:hypothetical protein